MIPWVLFFSVSCAGAHLREKTQTYLKMKADLAVIRAESVVLRRTEQILKSRDEVGGESHALTLYHTSHLGGTLFMHFTVFFPASIPSPAT